MRKPYDRPILKPVGDITDLTRGSRGPGSADGIFALFGFGGS